MSTKPKVLIQLDPDAQASSFDSMVAIDSGIDHLLRYANVRDDQVESLTHGAMFTRGGDDLKHTAIFLGGSNVANTEALVDRVTNTFFGPVRVSLMSDPNGSNTTAAAAVLSAQQHTSMANKKIVILGGTGPVGQRIARLIASQTDATTETRICVCSRTLEKATLVTDTLSKNLQDRLTGSLVPTEVASLQEAAQLSMDADVIFAAGAAGVTLLDQDFQSNRNPILIDLNAVPPEGILKVKVTDKGNVRDNAICYGAIGVGGLKMKIHKQCIRSLFESNDKVLNTDEIYRVGTSLTGPKNS